MASVKLSHIYKVYPNGLKAVNDFSMDIEDREFIVFVGPSGCGKSTTLRMIAGLEDITAGELRIGDEVMNDVEPKDRDIAMVFQNYALYPHMTVYDNMAFGLQLRRMGKDEIKKRVNEAAKILGITEYLQKKPKEMSGGQRQRVALGRAMVREPKVFLLDEPLSNLDAKLRTQMRAEILKLHDKIKTTFIYVTHDQVEAMTMGTRIVVMKEGFVQQIDTPRNLYSYPCNKFVAGFIGTPQMNFYAGTMKRSGDSVRICFDGTAAEFDAPYELFAKADSVYMDGEKKVCFGIRSEHISIDPEKYPYTAKCKVSYCEDLGVESQVYADFNIDGDSDALDSDTKVVIKAPAATFIDKDSVIDVSLDFGNIHIFDAETEKSVMMRVPESNSFGCSVKDGKLKLLGSEFDLPPAIKLCDGAYTVEVPADALKPGGSLKAEFLDKDDIGGISLLRYKADDTIFFVRSSGGSRGKGVSVDFKRCSFLCDGAVKVAAIPAENSLECKFLKRTERETQKVDGEDKNVKTVKYSIGFESNEYDVTVEKSKGGKIKADLKKAAIGDAVKVEVEPSDGHTLKALMCDGEDITADKSFVMPDRSVHISAVFDPDDGVPQTEETAEHKDKKPEKVVRFSFDCNADDAQKIMTGAGRMVYKDDLEIRFSPYAVKDADKGIYAVVEDILDYGAEKLAKCRVGEQTVYMAVDNGFDKKAVRLLPDAQNIKVFDKTIDIRLV